jgi:hypothetical protein
MEKTEFLNFLADLTINGENFEIALAALKLQGELQKVETKAEFEKDRVVFCLVKNGEFHAFYTNFKNAVEGFKKFLKFHGKKESRNLKIREFKYEGDLSFEELSEKYRFNLTY